VEETLEMTVPLSETQLQDLLSNSPLVGKIQDIADLLADTQQGGLFRGVIFSTCVQ
jgi:hypothetical protein